MPIHCGICRHYNSRGSNACIELSLNLSKRRFNKKVKGSFHINIYWKVDLYGMTCTHFEYFQYENDPAS